MSEPREILELHGPWFQHPDGRFVDKRDLPCKEEPPHYVNQTGGCLRCTADAGIACRDRKRTQRGTPCCPDCGSTNVASNPARCLTCGFTP